MCIEIDNLSAGAKQMLLAMSDPNRKTTINHAYLYFKCSAKNLPKMDTLGLTDPVLVWELCYVLCVCVVYV